MKNPDERVLKAIIKYSSDPGFISIKSWIEESFKLQLNNLVDDNSDKAAGAVSELREIYDTFINARAKLDKLVSIQSRKPNP